MQTDAEVAAIARRLTKPQREAIFRAEERRPGRWHVPNAGRVRDKLHAMGLVYLAVPDFSWRSSRRDTVLSDLGLRVAQHLKQENAK
jgi:hypothetical protein